MMKNTFLFLFVSVFSVLTQASELPFPAPRDPNEILAIDVGFQMSAEAAEQAIDDYYGYHAPRPQMEELSESSEDEASEPEHQPVETRRKPGICRFWKKYGQCNRGDSCVFAHSIEQQPLCRYFERNGFCIYGDGCHFVHRPSQND